MPVKPRVKHHVEPPKALMPGSDTHSHLAFYHELDPWQQDNHYIRSGYVKETRSYAKCFRLLLYLHNESVNIYSHLIPSCLVLFAVWIYLQTRLPIYDNYLGSWEKWNFMQFAFACAACMFMSSTFHCVKAHSLTVCKRYNQFDYFGIVILITFSLNSIMLFGFYDVPKVKWFFVCLFLVLGSACTVLTLHPDFAIPLYRPIRSAMFVLFGLSGVLPVLVAIHMYGWEVARDRASIQWLILEGTFYIGGAFLYAMRIPERFTYVDQDHQSLLAKPMVGRFDIFGNSHQIFHVMVVIASYCHWRALLACYRYLHEVTLL